MKKLMLLLGLLCIFPNAWANNEHLLSGFIPEYARSNHPSCTCDCDNKIIYKGGDVTAQTLSLWAKEAAVTAYSFGFGNYEVALRKASQYFTPKGWDEFREALNQSGNLDLIIQNHLLVSAIPAGEPTNLQKNSVRQSGAWKVQIPLVMKYDSANASVSKPVMVTLLIVQTNPRAGLQGLGIEQFIVEPRSNI